LITQRTIRTAIPNPHPVTLLGATIFEVKTPQNAPVGQNKCIDDGAIGVYGRSDETTRGIGVTGACDQGCGVAGIATSATADLPPALAPKDLLEFSCLRADVLILNLDFVGSVVYARILRGRSIKRSPQVVALLA